MPTVVVLTLFSLERLAYFPALNLCSMEIPDSSMIADGASVGVSYDQNSTAPIINEDCVIRSGTLVYDDVTLARGVQTGHHAVIREWTTIGEGSLIGTHVVIDGATDIGKNVSMQTNVYVPRETTIEDNVFLGPSATLLNDPYPVRTDSELEGPTIRSHASIGANATILPSVSIGRGSFVAAGAVVTEDVPSKTLAVGVPADHRPLPDDLGTQNQL